MNIALIGIGYWGEKLEIAINNHPNLNLMYKTGSGPREKILSDKDVDAVIIATPIKTHYEVAKDALLHNKHVYSAKPLATNTRDMDELIAIAKDKGLHISVDYTTTFSSELPEIKNSIGLMGGAKVILMKNCSWGRFNEYDVYWLYASHMLAMLSLFKDLGDLKFEFSDIVVNNDICDIGYIKFDCGRISVSRLSHDRKFQIDFHCIDGIVRYHPSEIFKSSISKPGSITRNWSTRCTRSSAWSDNGIEMSLNHFYNVLIGKEESNIQMARKVTEIISTRGGELDIL